MSKAVHAVLSDRIFAYLSPDSEQIKTFEVSPYSVGTDILNLAERHNVSSVWIAPESQVSRLRRTDSWDIDKWDSVEGLTKDNYLKTVTAHRRGGGPIISLVWPELTAWSWDPTVLGMTITPKTILSAIDYEEKALQTEMVNNPGVLGRNLIRQANSQNSRPDWIRAPQTLLSLPSDIAYDLTWINPQATLTNFFKVAQGKDLYLHFWDKNSMYLGAASGVNLGSGQPLHVVKGIGPIDPASLWDGRLVGYWKLEDIQDPLGLTPRYKGQEWMTTSLLKCFLSLGGRGRITECWLWRESHRILDTFATDLWAARQDLKDEKKYKFTRGRELAYYSVKRVATAAIGMLANEDVARYKPQWYRPDWRAGVVEEGKVRLIYKIKQLERIYKTLPALVVTDDLGYISTERDHRRVFIHPGATLGRPDDLGGYKHAQTIRVTPEIVSLFQSGYSPAKIRGMIKNMGKTEVLV